MNLTNELAKQRNRDAAERTLMAWIRTCLSLISFGFGLDKIVGAIDRAAGGQGAQVEWGVQLVAAAFTITGILAMAGATVQYRRELRRLHQDDYIYRDKPQIAAATAVMLTLIGVLALGLIAARAGSGQQADAAADGVAVQHEGKIPNVGGKQSQVAYG